jgi:colicin import membrane protein
LKWRIVHRILDEAGYTGRRNLIPLNFYAKEEAIMPTEEKPSTTKPEAKDTRKHDYVETPHGEFRKDSVLHIIYRGLARAGGATKAELAEMLEEKHPTSKGETPWAEKSTINCQIDRMPDERGFTLARTAKGKYGIEPKGEHKFSGLTGWDKTRVLSPEQAKAKAEKEAAKAEKEKAKAKEKAEKEAAKAKAKEAEEKAKATAKAEADKKQAAADAKAQAEKAKADKLK